MDEVQALQSADVHSQFPLEILLRIGIHVDRDEKAR